MKDRRGGRRRLRSFDQSHMLDCFPANGVDCVLRRSTQLYQEG